MNFQPILPIPLYGDGPDRWNLIARPAVPIVFGQPRPDGFDKTTYEGGLSDILLPLLVAPPLENKNLIFGLGPTFTLPTATNQNLSRRQWQTGPAAVFGYKTKDYVLGVFPQYFFGVGGRGDQGSAIDDASNMNLLYFGFINLPNAWQIGTNPVVTYDNKASKGNRWNVPLGITATKTIKIGKAPVKIQFGIEYSVVSQDDFGKVAQFKLTFIPVIPSLIQRPVLGGGS